MARLISRKGRRAARAGARPSPNRLQARVLRPTRASFALTVSSLSLSRIPASRLHHLAEGPEAHPLAVGKTATLAPGDESRTTASNIREQLVDDPGLPDSRNADQRDELRLSLLARTLERLVRRRELSLTPDERRARRPARRRRRTCELASQRFPRVERAAPCPSRAPASSPGSRSPASVARYVAAPTRMPPTGAAACRRAAVFTTSPAAMPSPASGRASSGRAPRRC